MELKIRKHINKIRNLTISIEVVQRERGEGENERERIIGHFVCHLCATPMVVNALHPFTPTSYLFWTRPQSKLLLDISINQIHTYSPKISGKHVTIFISKRSATFYFQMFSSQVHLSPLRHIRDWTLGWSPFWAKLDTNDHDMLISKLSTY